MNAVRRAVVAACAAGALALSGCGQVPAQEADASTTSPTQSATPSPSFKLPPPEPDGRIAGPLSKVALSPRPPFFSPRGASGAARTGPFTLRSYVADFHGGDKQFLADLRLARLRRGYHRFSTSGQGVWLHVYLFECRDNYGADTLKRMLFGSMDAESYVPRLIEGALAHIERNNRDSGGRYSSMEVAFVTGNVYARVMVGTRGKRLHPRFVERLALAQQQLLRRAIAPTA